MPILEVEVVLAVGERLPAGMAATLAEAAAGVFRSPEGSTWVRLHELPADRYAENGGESCFMPVFVHVLKAQLPSEKDLEREAAELAAAVATVCGGPVENVHIIYEPPAAGRIAFGGKLLRSVHEREG
jgi:phenylpyruvate tautomerase PptA (4-oxalocrotonate tautomerase family)